MRNYQVKDPISNINFDTVFRSLEKLLYFNGKYKFLGNSYPANVSIVNPESGSAELASREDHVHLLESSVIKDEIEKILITLTKIYYLLAQIVGEEISDKDAEFDISDDKYSLFLFYLIKCKLLLEKAV